MPCSLTSDPSLAFDFLARTGSSSTLFVENDAGTASIESADFNGNDVPIAVDKITVTEKLGTNILTITINGAQNGDQVRLKEDCGAGASEIRKTFTFRGDPVRRYQINAS